MTDMRFKPDEPVRFWWNMEECTGIVETHQKLGGFVLLRSTDVDHKWAHVLAVRESQVWLPGDEPPVAQKPSDRTEWPALEGAEPTAS